jgi:hypothetical protein
VKLKRGIKWGVKVFIGEEITPKLKTRKPVNF